jgi:hypothetical protein
VGWRRERRMSAAAQLDRLQNLYARFLASCSEAAALWMDTNYDEAQQGWLRDEFMSSALQGLARLAALQGELHLLAPDDTYDAAAEYVDLIGHRTPQQMKTQTQEMIERRTAFLKLARRDLGRPLIA